MYSLGIDLGGTNIAIGIVDENHNIIEKGSVPTLADRDPELIVKDMAALCKKLLDNKKISFEEVSHVGIASPGAVNPETGVVDYANNLPFLDFHIADILKKYLPVKNVYLGNDANAAALGEALAGAAKGASSSVMITLGTGVGGGIIINGKIYDGFNHAGAELGHIVIKHNGRLCSCGRRGCFEAYSSATALTNKTKEVMEECKRKDIPTALFEEAGPDNHVSAKTAFSAAKKGDAISSIIVHDYIDYLACGLANIINIFQPEVLTIGGGVSNEKDNLLKPLLSIIDHEQYTRKNPKKTKIMIATLGNDAGIIGAAGLDQA